MDGASLLPPSPGGRLHAPGGRLCDVRSGKNKGSGPREAGGSVRPPAASQLDPDTCKMALELLIPKSVAENR